MFHFTATPAAGSTQCSVVVFGSYFTNDDRLDGFTIKNGKGINRSTESRKPSSLPTAVIDQRVGRETILTEAVQEAIPIQVRAAVQEHEVRVLGRPEVEITEFADGIWTIRVLFYREGSFGCQDAAAPRPFSI